MIEIETEVARLVGLVDQAARLLAYDDIHRRLKPEDPRRVRFMREWAVALAVGPCSTGEFLYAFDTSPYEATYWRTGQKSGPAVHFVAGVVGGALAINIEGTEVEEDECLRVPRYRFDFKMVPQRFARWAAIHALKRRARCGEGEIDEGVRFMEYALRDEEGWRSHAFPLTDTLFSMNHGALWATFRNDRRFHAHRWAWMASWFSLTRFEDEVERYKRGVQFISPRHEFRKFSHEEAVKHATRWATDPTCRWVVKKWPDSPTEKVLLTEFEIERCRAIIRRAKEVAVQIENRLGPAHIDMTDLRKPPWATLQQHLCHHLVKNKGMTWAATARALGISTPQEVGRAVKIYEERQAEREQAVL